jgi:hypothetical protein
LGAKIASMNEWLLYFPEKRTKNWVAWVERGLQWLAQIWTLVFIEEWLNARLSLSAILLLSRLSLSLCNNQLPERVGLVIKEVKCRLLDKYWPPQRQRCDSIPAPAI